MKTLQWSSYYNYTESKAIDLCLSYPQRYPQPGDDCSSHSIFNQVTRHLPSKDTRLFRPVKISGEPIGQTLCMVTENWWLNLGRRYPRASESHLSCILKHCEEAGFKRASFWLPRGFILSTVVSTSCQRHLSIVSESQAAQHPSCLNLQDMVQVTWIMTPVWPFVRSDPWSICQTVLKCGKLLHVFIFGCFWVYSKHLVTENGALLVIWRCCKHSSLRPQEAQLAQ